MGKDVFLLADNDYEWLKHRVEEAIRRVEPEAQVRDLSGWSWEYASPDAVMRQELKHCVMAVVRDDAHRFLVGVLAGIGFPWVHVSRVPPTKPGESGGLYQGDPALLIQISETYEMELQRARAPVAFISYVREDSRLVEQLCGGLNSEGIQTWRDKDQLVPGSRWQNAIRDAIKNHAIAFIACFSTHFEARHRSYMNEELTVAVEEARLRPRDRAWLFPVRLDECAIPSLSLGAGETLDHLQSVDWFRDPLRETARLAAAIHRLAAPPTGRS